LERICPSADRIIPRAWITNQDFEEDECVDSAQEHCQLQNKRECRSHEASSLWIRPDADEISADDSALPEEEIFDDPREDAAAADAAVGSGAALDKGAAAGASVDEAVAVEKQAAVEKVAGDGKGAADEETVANEKANDDENAAYYEKAAVDEKAANDGKAAADEKEASDQDAAESRAAFELFARSALETENISASPKDEIAKVEERPANQIPNITLQEEKRFSGEKIIFPSDK